MLKITIYLTFKRSPTMISGSFNYQRTFSVKYVVMDTSNIVLWVSVCIRNMNVKDFTLAAFKSYMESL